MSRPQLRLTSPVSRYVAMVLDIFIIWACAAGAYVWHHDLPLPALQLFDVFNVAPPIYTFVVLAATLVLMACSGRIYRSWRVNALWEMLQSVAATWMVAVMGIVVWLFLSKSSSEVSRVWFVAWSGGTLLVLFSLRVVVYLGLHGMRRAGYNLKTVLLVGSGPSGLQVQKALADAAWSGLRVQGMVDSNALSSFLANPELEPSDEVWLCLSLGDKAGIEAALTALRHSTANIRLVPDWFSLKLINHGMSEVLGIPMLDLSASPIFGITRVLKAIEDFVLGTFIVLLICPVMLCIALAIKLTSKGPVLFKQLRHGWNGEDILIYKFRSMVVHDDGPHGVTQATRNDARITPLGAFLRRTSLDELPQFINVLQGRMSIVGPRPHAVQHNDHYKELLPGYMLRHKVKPGITGWAQVNGFRGETDTLEKMKKRVEYDLYYIEHLSVWLDLKIILATLFRGWVHTNAY